MSDQRPTGERRPTRPTRDEDVDRPRRTADRERPPARGERTGRSGDRGDERARPRDGEEPRRHSDQAGGERRRPRDDGDPPRRSTEQADGRQGGSGSGEEPRRPQSQQSERDEQPLDVVAASRIALDALQSMTSRAAEGVVGVERGDDGGWLVVVELLEASRIPTTADVLGEYEVEIGPDRTLRSYTRRSRYTRASTMTD